MTIEISEIGIRMKIGPGDAPTPPGSPPAGQEQPPSPQPLSPQARESLVARCVRQVLAALRLSAQR